MKPLEIGRRIISERCSRHFSGATPCRMWLAGCNQSLTGGAESLAVCYSAVSAEFDDKVNSQQHHVFIHHQFMCIFDLILQQDIMEP
jgi:hypothetical protein